MWGGDACVALGGATTNCVGAGAVRNDSNILPVQHIERRKTNRPLLSFFADAQNDKQALSTPSVCSSTFVMLLDEYIGINGAVRNDSK
jgi:hypothetical protein